ncbi:MAG: hypothetical protein ACOYOB_09310 [Myxococcota bacterium]
MNTRSQLLLPLMLSLAVAVSACDSATSDTGATAVAKAGFGERCDDDAGCSTGLTCQKSEYNTFSWCTRPCDNPGDYCSGDGLGGGKGFCVQMTAGWRGPAEAFCAPYCSKLADCKGLDAQWEACSKPDYKGTPLYPALPVLVCQSPSAHGQLVVDPATCDWESHYTKTPFLEVKNECKLFCQFLTTCKLQPSTIKPECCSWQCFRWVTPNDQVDYQRLSGSHGVKCFTKSFTSHSETGNVCTAWQDIDDCAPLPW